MRKTGVTICWVLLPALMALPVAVPAGEWYCEAPCETDLDWQWFAPVDELCCEEFEPASEGYFFGTERFDLWLLRPEKAAVGIPGQVNAYIPTVVNYVYVGQVGNDPGTLTPIVFTGAQGLQPNGINDAYSRAVNGWGNGYEFGRVHDRCGWIASIIYGLDMNHTDRYGFDDKRVNQLAAAQGLNGVDGMVMVDANGNVVRINPIAPVPGIQSIPAFEGLETVPVIFSDPFGYLTGIPVGGGDPTRIGVLFDDMSVTTRMEVDSVELMAIRRKRRLHNGCDVDVFAGARFLNLDERFIVVARGGALADSDWQNRVKNRIVGPQIGFRTSRQRHRWSTSFEGRFLAGANFMSIRQNGTLGSHLATGFMGIPFAWGGTTFFNRLGDELFAPVGEFEFDLGFQVTKTVALTAGWKALVMGGINRASNTVVYELPTMGIAKQEDVAVAHGFSLGVEINR
jgi:hypothetical protein